MKIASLVIGACLVSVVTGCHKPQAGDMVGVAEDTIKTTALASITAKYPSVSSSDLKFSEIRITATPQGTEDILVIYELPASETPTTDAQGAKTPTTSTKMIGVRMSRSAKVESVNESTIRKTYSLPYHANQ
jgi:hypothetical protein